jgi:hypothetical protein
MIQTISPTSRECISLVTRYWGILYFATMKDGRDGGFEYVEEPFTLDRAWIANRSCIDKDYPLTGVVICFTSVQIERRVSADRSSRTL